MTSTILATFDDTAVARSAIEDLTEAGFKRGDIGLAVYDADEEYTDADGASVGGLFGAVFGAAVGLVAITIPGVGPVIAAGPLAAAFGAVTGAGIGAVAGLATGGLTDWLVGMGIPEEDAHYYAESLRRGAALVSVTAHQSDVDRAVHILQSFNPVDMNRRVTQWRNRGWSGFDPMVDPYTASPLAEEDHEDDDGLWDEETYPAEADDRRREEEPTSVRIYPGPHNFI